MTPAAEKVMDGFEFVIPESFNPYLNVAMCSTSEVEEIFMKSLLHFDACLHEMRMRGYALPNMDLSFDGLPLKHEFKYRPLD